MLTCEASVDLVVARPEPEDSAVQTLHPVHGGGSHLLKVVSTVLAAEEVANVAPDGLEDFLSLGCFLHVVCILPSCLHGQEVEEDPQGAGEAPKVWLTPLAADPVHLLGNHSTLKDTGEHERIYGEDEGWKAG